MKISIVCDSLLLSEALERFLKDYLSSYVNSEIVVTDKFLDIDKPTFLIGKSVESNISKPFTKATLLLKLQEFYDSIQYDKVGESDYPKLDMQNIDDESLRIKINFVAQKFAKELYEAITEHYGKK